MPCTCDQCLQNSRTLGLSARAHSKAAIHKAYREAAKRSHPDLFETDPGLQPVAEERFKQVQIAYRELTEHHQNPAEFTLQTTFAKPAPPAPFSFDNMPGCFTAPHFPPRALDVIAAHLGPDHNALAIVDLSRHGALAGDFSQFILLASHGVILRDALNMVSLIWYADLGEVNMIDQRRDGKLALWQKLLEKISGTQQKYSLQIYRRNGAHFYSLAGEADDSVKRVIYNFLLRQKYQTNR